MGKNIFCFIVLFFSPILINNADACAKRGVKTTHVSSQAEVSSLNNGNSELNQLLVNQLNRKTGEFSSTNEDQNLAELRNRLDKKSQITDQVLVSYSILLTSMIINHFYPNEVANQILTQLEAILTADFITGTFHWLEDTYGGMGTEKAYESGIGFFVGQIIKANRLHHSHPREMLKSTPIQHVGKSAMAATVVGVLLFPFLTCDQYPYVFSVLAWASAANLIHSWAHMDESQIPGFVKYLQGTVFQVKAEHGIHHTATDRRYCVITDLVNPLVEGINWWRRLEEVVQVTTGIPPRQHE